MKSSKTLRILSRIYIFFSAASLLYVSLMAFASPQAVMDLVQVKLPNPDSFSSIRGVYGGVGLTIVVMLVRWALRDERQGILFLTMLWGFYAISRLMTLGMEGPLGAFGMQWLITESFLCAVGAILLIFQLKAARIARA
ncbi:DUF4345 domain-containing protein [Chitinophaga rhizosphaerae]|uniref:DUF4345 domain-containing protein n=1 Tax=Chitinophaga rhizosphaerae TaxID=1864947 RepID=UPI000F80C0AF|nr:DUF4345 domain-containing protein [Chitinophaga rhizosphaerae]